jgi:tetratricopeptide (TPR) repeat protein
MVEDIITELSRFHSLFVIARNSSFVYKGRSANIKEVGRTLGVRYVAEGSVRRLGNRVRVTAQLIDAKTGSHLWAERFDRELEDIFAVQDEVARRIVTSIAPLVEAESLQLAKRKPPQDMQAYDYYLKARPLVDGPRSVADVREARDYCNRAIQIDPSYARAYACKALSYIAGFLLMETDDVEEWRKQALQWAEQAVALDAMDGVNQWALGEATFYLRQYDRSCRHMARAVSLNPNDADVLAVSGFIQTACGHSELGLLHMEMARERNPSNPPWYNWIMGGTLYLVGRYDDALAAFDLFGRRNAATLRWRAATLVQLGRIEEARTDTHALLAIKPDLSVGVVRKFFDYLPNIDSYVDSLRRAGLPE